MLQQSPHVGRIVPPGEAFRNSERQGVLETCDPFNSARNERLICLLDIISIAGDFQITCAVNFRLVAWISYYGVRGGTI